MAELVGTLAALNSDADAAGSLFDEAHRSAEAIRKFEWVIEADRSRKAADLRLKAVADSLDSLATRRETVGGGLLNRREKRRLELGENCKKSILHSYTSSHLDEKLEVASSEVSQIASKKLLKLKFRLQLIGPQLRLRLKRAPQSSKP